MCAMEPSLRLCFNSLFITSISRLMIGLIVTAQALPSSDYRRDDREKISLNSFSLD
jgi:hypothetical protein